MIIALRTISSIFKNKWKSWKIENLSIFRIFYSPQTISTGKKIYTTTMYIESQTFFLKKAFLPLFHNPPNRVMAPSERSELGAYQTFTGSGVLHLEAESPNLMQLLSQINPLWRCPREKVGGAKRSSRTGQCRGHKGKKYFLIFVHGFVQNLLIDFSFF